MKQIKKVLSIIFVTILTLGCTTTSFGAENNSVQIYSEGQLVNTGVDTDIQIIDGIVYVSTDFLNKNFNIQCTYSSDKTVFLVNDYATLQLFFYNGYFIDPIKGKEYFTGVSAKVINGKTYVPLVKTLQFLGFSVISENNYISVTKLSDAQLEYNEVMNELDNGFSNNKPETISYPLRVKATNGALNSSPYCLVNLSFLSKEGYSVPAVGTAYIKIVNNSGEEIYYGGFSFSSANFTYHQNTCSIDLKIPVGYGMVSTGKLYCAVDLGDDYWFRFESDVSNLPAYKSNYYIPSTNNVLS